MQPSHRVMQTKPPGMQSSIFMCLPSQDKLGGLQQEGHPA